MASLQLPQLPKRITLIDQFLENPYLMAFIKVSLVLYAATVAPRLPIAANKVLENTFFKVGFIFLMLYISQMDFQLAMILAIAYVVSINLLSGRSALESFADFKKFEGESKHTLIEPQSVVYPGCNDIKLDDLLNAFKKDRVALQTSIRYVYHKLLAEDKSTDEHQRLLKFARMSGLPYNVELSDKNAPFIATLLLYYGFEFSDSCKPPQ